MKATRTDVARLAGVSTATVSNVLNGSNKVKEATVRRVMEAVQQLDYRPDMIARSMTTKRTMQIGIVLEDVINPYYGEVMREFELAANEKNYFVNICTGLHKLDSYFDNFITNREVFSCFGFINNVGQVFSDIGFICRNYGYGQFVNFAEFCFFRQRCTCHTRKFRIKSEKVLESNTR